MSHSALLKTFFYNNKIFNIFLGPRTHRRGDASHKEAFYMKNTTIFIWYLRISCPTLSVPNKFILFCSVAQHCQVLLFSSIRCDDLKTINIKIQLRERQKGCCGHAD